MPYILSPEQKVVVDALTCKETSSTKYFDVFTALQAISKGCSSALGDGKKILIHIPDQETKQLLANSFSTHGLDDLTIDISKESDIPELDIIKLRSTLKKEKDIDALIKYVLSNKKSKKQLDELTKFYKAFDVKVMADIPFRDFTTNIIYNKNSNRPKLTISSQSDKFLKFTGAEFYQVKKEINKAAKLYLRRYELFDHLSLFKSNLWNEINEAKIQEIKNQLNEFRTESGQLSSDFVQATNNLFDFSSLDLKKAFDHLNQRFLHHEEACIAYHIKATSDIESNEGIFSLFKKKKTQVSNKIYVEAFDDLTSLIQGISSEWYDTLDAPTSDMISYDYIIKFIEENREIASTYKKEITKNLEQSVQRINKINTSSQEVIQLDQRLESLIDKMNNSDLFDLELNHNILSFLKQAELCNNIAEYIEKCHILFHSSATYLEWKSFFNSSSDIFKLIFDEIKKLPENLWNDGFENWYEQKVQKHTLGDHHISSKELKVYFDQANISNQSEIQSLIAQLHTQRIEGIEQLKSSNKELYNNLFKRKQLPSVSWKNIALMNRPFMQSVFPIHLSDNLAHINEYDLVITFSRPEEDDSVKVHYFAPIESKDIQNISDKKDNFLYLNDYNYKGLLKDLSSTDKLKASKKLAKYILSLNQNIKIYQLKNANIISLLPAIDDAQLEDELDQLNAKVIDTNGVLYDRLTESILFTERSPILIVKDELINSELHEHILWQLKILQTFEEVGYKIISFNTTDQLINNQRQFDQLINSIGHQQEVPPEISPLSPKQLEKNHEEV